MMSQVQVLLRPPQYTSPERDPTGGFLCSNEHCMIARRICEFVSQTAGMQIGRGQIAQSVEQRTENPCVPSSNLGLATTIISCIACGQRHAFQCAPRSEADVAQMAERVTRNDQVTGSIPVVGSMLSSPHMIVACASDRFLRVDWRKCSQFHTQP
jgi:hypothetical protein